MGTFTSIRIGRKFLEIKSGKIFETVDTFVSWNSFTSACEVVVTLKDVKTGFVLDGRNVCVEFFKLFKPL